MITSHDRIELCQATTHAWRMIHEQYQQYPDTNPARYNYNYMDYINMR